MILGSRYIHILGRSPLLIQEYSISIMIMMRHAPHKRFADMCTVLINPLRVQPTLYPGGDCWLTTDLLHSTDLVIGPIYYLIS